MWNSIFMSSGLQLFQRAELLYQQGKPSDTFEYYQKSIKKILKDENVIAKIPFPVPADFPQELICVVWRNFLGFLRDPTMNFTEKSHPDAYKLLNSFRPSAPKPHPRLERTSRGKVIIKAMQITAALTLGVLAWDQRDRATAAKRYQEALDVADTHPPFTSLAPGTVGLEKWVHEELEQGKDNLAVLIVNDTVNAGLWGAETKAGEVPTRRDVVDLPVPQTRIDKTGAVTQEKKAEFATTPCKKCGVRAAKLQRCSVCRNVFCQ
ncbi:hypothetical protein H0H81_006060 [Sphagnurus paluster]|uniref:Uncharacterized protein n=1 Tax=Sphagnurus paluster TaxID=117069 RepID=A0A9P7FTK2_9AGAR|nr:hypothetical protein H0H81_006060 [Sphagnurus paluster]